MSVATEIQRIQNAKTRLKEILIDKNVSVGNERLDELVELTEEIKGGNGTDTTDATASANDILKGKTAYTKDGKIEGTIETYNLEMSEGAVSGNTLKNLLDATKNASYLFYNYFGNEFNNLIQYNDTENVENFEYMFGYVGNYGQGVSLPLLNTKNGKKFKNTFFSVSEGTIFPGFNVSNSTNFYNMYAGCSRAISILMYGMKVDFTISACTKLEAEALVTILSNCQAITSTQTLTMGSTLLAKLEGVFVKETGVELYDGITCIPCVICESTDAGAMLATDYITMKGWTLA